MRRISIRHVTRYSYMSETEFHEHRLLLRPREGHDIRIESSGLGIEPANSVSWHRDVYGNSVATVTFFETSTRLSIESRIVIQHYEEEQVPLTLSPHAVTFPFQYGSPERADVSPYQLPLFARGHDELREWVSEFWSPGQVLPTGELLERINAAIPARLSYLRREEPGVQRPSETLANGSGSCRDFATLFIETCRHLGIAARFVSGYLHAPGLPAAEGATHAWGEIYLPGAGWRGYDSTTGGPVGADHIAVAVSRTPESVPPVEGSITTQDTQPATMQVEVSVKLANEMTD